MRQRHRPLVVVAAATLVLHNQNVAFLEAAPAPECYDSLNPIYEAELLFEGRNVTDVDAATGEIVRRYHLCPDSVFRIANEFDQGQPSDGGQYPLVVTRSHVHVLCGSNGNPEDNCVLQDGHVQLGFFQADGDEEEPISNVVIQGLTFEGARYMNVEAQAAGRMSLVDCVFKVSALCDTCVSSSLSFLVSSLLSSSIHSFGTFVRACVLSFRTTRTSLRLG